MQPRLEQHPRAGQVPPVAGPAQPSVPSRRPTEPAADDASGPLRDRGISLLTIFTSAMLLIVALVCLVAGIDRWWILIPVMAVDLGVTGGVMAIMARLLNEGSGT